MKSLTSWTTFIIIFCLFEGVSADGGESIQCPTLERMLAVRKPILLFEICFS